MSTMLTIQHTANYLQTVAQCSCFELPVTIMILMGDHLEHNTNHSAQFVHHLSTRVRLGHGRHAYGCPIKPCCQIIFHNFGDDDEQDDDDDNGERSQ